MYILKGIKQIRFLHVLVSIWNLEERINLLFACFMFDIQEILNSNQTKYPAFRALPFCFSGYNFQLDLMLYSLLSRLQHYIATNTNDKVGLKLKTEDQRKNCLLIVIVDRMIWFDILLVLW